MIIILSYTLLNNKFEKFNNNKGKIAFLFLTRDNITTYDTWMKYLKGNDDRYSIYVHPKNPEKVTQKLIKDNIIKEHVETGWGTIGSVRANLLLLKYALMDPMNKMFILVSESCMPVQSFNNFYDFIFKDMKTYMCYFVQDLHRYDNIKNPKITKDMFKKHCAQGIVFNRNDAMILVNNDITKDWENVGCVDESYFYNNITMKDKINNYKITYDIFGNEKDVGLSYDHLKMNMSSGSMPSFVTLNNDFIDMIKKNGYYFMRKIDKDCIYNISL